MLAKYGKWKTVASVNPWDVPFIVGLNRNAEMSWHQADVEPSWKFINIWQRMHGRKAPLSRSTVGKTSCLMESGCLVHHHSIRRLVYGMICVSFGGQR
jgi:hypothetical protein